MTWMHETEEMIAADKKTIIDQERRIRELEADQSDWRKGMNFIRVSLGDDDQNLSCTRLGEIALKHRAKIEELEAELAKEKRDSMDLRRELDAEAATVDHLRSLLKRLELCYPIDAGPSQTV